MVIFKVKTILGERILKGVTSWEQVPQALFEDGLVNVGEVHVYKLEYELISTTPHIVDTTYKASH
ncbi:hypothetical protein ALT721_800036 [Alteromonas alvinellae]